MPALRPPPPLIRIDRASLFMVGCALAFATMGSLAHQLGSRCDWLVVALVRVVFMMATTATLAVSAGSRLAIWRPRALWVRSLAGSFSLVCNFYAFAHLPVADAVTLMNVQPLWVVLLSSALAGRWPGKAEALGVAAGLTGVVLIERPELGVNRLAAAVALISSMTSAVAMMGLNRLRHLDPRAVVAHFAGVASLVSFAWILARGGSPLSGLASGTALALLAGVCASGTIGQVLLTRAYAAGAPARMAVVGLTQVAFALAFDVALWGRAIGPVDLLGFGLVLAPSTWLSLRAARASETVPESETPVGP